jgi:hypothetical protein
LDPNTAYAGATEDLGVTGEVQGFTGQSE